MECYSVITAATHSLKTVFLIYIKYSVTICYLPCAITMPLYIISLYHCTIPAYVDNKCIPKTSFSDQLLDQVLNAARVQKA